jgi:hypothetical protein
MIDVDRSETVRQCPYPQAQLSSPCFPVTCLCLALAVRQWPVPTILMLVAGQIRDTVDSRFSCSGNTEGPAPMPNGAAMAR